MVGLREFSTRGGSTRMIDDPRFEAEGYRPLRLLGRRDVAAIRRALRAFPVDDEHAFFASPYHAHGPAARAFHDRAKAVVAARVEAVLPGYRVFMVAATTKGRLQGQPIKFHHDWTYTDERRHVPMFFWCPLVDVDERNGALMVVPGSHQWCRAIRPSRQRQITEDFQAECAERAVLLPLRAGEAVAFHPGLLHGSGPNPTRRARPAITIAAAPREAELVHFHEDGDGGLQGAVVDEAFFTEHEYGTAPDGYPPLEAWDRTVTADDLRAGLGARTPSTAP